MESISKDTLDVAAISEENAASTEETSAAIEEQIAQVTEIAQSAKHLEDSANDLSGIVAQFKIDSGKVSSTSNTTNKIDVDDSPKSGLLDGAKKLTSVIKPIVSKKSK